MGGGAHSVFSSTAKYIVYSSQREWLRGTCSGSSQSLVAWWGPVDWSPVLSLVKRWHIQRWHWRQIFFLDFPSMSMGKKPWNFASDRVLHRIQETYRQLGPIKFFHIKTKTVLPTDKWPAKYSVGSIASDSTSNT